MGNRPEVGALADLLLGPVIGRGRTRTVYALNRNPGHVVKVEGPGTWDNVAEWTIWRAVRKSPAARWLAPARELSRDGRLLIMVRTAQLRADELPSDIPAYLNADAGDNLGWLGGHVVFHDYAHALAELIKEASREG